MPAEGPTEEKGTKVGGTVAGVCQVSPHRAPQTFTVPGIVAQWRAQADGTSVTSAVRRGGRRWLTLSDSI